MKVVVNLEINENMLPDRAKANEYVKEQLRRIEKSGIVLKSVFPLKSEDEIFDSFMVGRREMIDSFVQKLVELLKYSSDKPIDVDRDFEDIGNITDGVSEYIEQVMRSQVCRPFKDDNNTPCYKTKDCKHPNCPFKL